MDMEKAKVDGELSKLIGALRQDGVDKGNEEASKIVERAKRESARIIDEARTESDQILKEARDKAQKTLDRLETQLDLALRDFKLKARGELQELIALKPIRELADKTLGDPEFMKKLIFEMISKDVDKPSGSKNIKITIPKDMEKVFTKEWIKMMKNELDASVEVHSKEGLLGFDISIQGDGGVRIVDPEAIVESLKPFVAEKFQYILERRTLPKE